MKMFLSEIRSSVAATLMLALVCCGLYPLVVYGIGQALFPQKANGSLIVAPDGTVRGSHLIGQHSEAENYSPGGPSVAGKAMASGSSAGTNLGPPSQKLRD